MSTSRRSHWTTFIPVRGKPSGIGSHNKFDRLTADFQQSFAIDDTSSTDSSRPSTTREGSFDSAVSSASSFTSTSITSNASKRSWQDEPDEESEQYEERNNSRGNKRHRKLIAKEQEPEKLFACPYAKWEPKRYSAANVSERNYRSCSKCYLKDISRLKQHLYRVHSRPIHYCPTCYKDFKQEHVFVEHVTLRSCLAQPCTFSEKMTSAQSAAIKKKSRGTNPYVNWYQIYETLFPQTPLPPSPYAIFCDSKPNTPNDFVQYIERHLPHRLRERLNNDALMSTSTQAIVMNVIENSIAHVLEDLKQDYDANLDNGYKATPTSSSQELHASIEHQYPTTIMQPSTSILPDFSRSNRPSQITLPARIHDTSAHISSPLTATISYQITTPISLDYESDGNNTNQTMKNDTSAIQPSQPNFNIKTTDGQYPDMLYGPMTVVWHPPATEETNAEPDSCMITTTTEATDYFVAFHPTTPAPISSIHFEDNGQWIPTMVLSSTFSTPGHGNGGDIGRGGQEDEDEDENQE